MQETIAKLNKLKNIKPDGEWKSRQRGILLQQVDSVTSNKQSNNFVIYLKETLSQELSALRQSAYTLAIITLLMVGGGFFSISAASEATPGSLMYTVKVVGERTQLTFTSKAHDKAELGVKFAERRAEEIQTLAQSNNYTEINDVAGSLHKEMQVVQERLAEINDPQVALMAAQNINNKTDNLSDSLKRSKNSLSESYNIAHKNIDLAIRTVESTSLRVLSTIIKESEMNKEVSDRVTAKLATTKEDIQVFSAGLGRIEKGIQVSESEQQDTEIIKEKTEEATKIIQEAEKLLKSENYEEAVDKIVASQKLISEAVDVINNEGDGEVLGTSTPEMIQSEEKQGSAQVSDEADKEVKENKK